MIKRAKYLLAPNVLVAPLKFVTEGVAVSGKDYNLILTDTAAYVMQFVGPPFTFSIRQVGSNCGCIGQHAVVYADGQVFWMGTGGGFFRYDGTVKLLPS